MSWFQLPPGQNHKRDVVCVPRKVFEDMSKPFVHHVQTNLVFVQFHVSNCGILNCTIGSNLFWTFQKVTFVTFEKGFRCNFELPDKNSKRDDNDKNLFLITNFMELFIIIQNALHISPKTMHLKCSFNFFYFLAITLDFLIITMKERKIAFSFNFIRDFNFLMVSTERVKQSTIVVFFRKQSKFNIVIN